MEIFAVTEEKKGDGTRTIKAYLYRSSLLNKAHLKYNCHSH